MKKENNFLMLIAFVLAISFSPLVNGQGRGHHKGHERNHDRNNNDKNHHDNHEDRDRDRDHHDSDHNNRDRHYRSNDRRQATHVYHHHDRYCNHTPVVIHHYQRPRYIYYRDYDVYYDCRRNVYISYSGRSWTVHTHIPFAMRHINLGRASRFEVDYYHDDFPQYLERRRPSYGREYRDW